jgi:hypothetical protein
MGMRRASTGYHPSGAILCFCQISVQAENEVKLQRRSHCASNHRAVAGCHRIIVLRAALINFVAQ